ncbi:MAG TPA: hypothetical protein VN714_01630 [Trebonia sp.]|jgi:uncharacterized membrane protein HdeD (DUF308 family)|nr:hypothetical protein [Trebonia sp.]
MPAAAAAATSAGTVSAAGHLRRLYFVRFVFAAAWAGTFAAIGSKIDAGSVTLLILYPAFDVAAAIFDVRSTRNQALYANIAISTAAAVGLAIATASDVPAVLRTWGAWAIIAGLVQLFVALRRRRALGGQWAMILSGGISVLAGAGFLGQASGATSMKMLAGYAVLGGIFFLISAVRLLRQGGQGTLAGAR